MAQITARFEQLHKQLSDIISQVSSCVAASGRSAENSDGGKLMDSLNEALSTLRSLQLRIQTTVNSVDWSSTAPPEQYAVSKAANVLEGKLERLESCLNKQPPSALQIGFAVHSVADAFLDIDRIVLVDLVSNNDNNKNNKKDLLSHFGEGLPRV